MIYSKEAFRDTSHDQVMYSLSFIIYLYGV